MKVTLAVAVPAMSFLVLNDTVQGFYGPKRELPLSYVVLEEEDLVPDDVEEPVAEDEVSEAAEAEPEAVEEDIAAMEDTATEDTATQETAVEGTVSDDATTSELATEETAAVDDAAVEVTPTAEAEASEDVVATMVAVLSPEEVQAGEAAARACASCHQFERERNAAGPHLVGIGGRVIGSVDGFRYSRALQDLNEEGRVWDMDSLQVWLENPDAFADGTRMMYNVQDAEERRLIAGWLTQRDN